MQMLKRKSGITLVALIITIIILLILAGVSLSFVFNGGILDKSQQTVNEYQNASQKEQDLLDQIDKYIENELGEMNTDDNVEQIEGNITDLVKPGDYVEYNPTVIDKNGTPVDSDKLTYTSPIGTIPTTEGEMITHGNGYSEQVFTANDSIKWQVLNVDKTTGVVELISENPIKTDEDSGFWLSGGIGYIYAEEELARICSIYGNGYGADTSLNISYTIGGPGEEIVKQINNNGARSTSVDDIDKLANITEEDRKTLDSNYGRTDILNEEVYYPTLYSINTTNPGRSEDKKINIVFNRYLYSNEKVKDINIRNIIFKDMAYWLSTRCFVTDIYESKSLCHNVLLLVRGNGIGDYCMVDGKNDRFIIENNAHYGNDIRPIVSLKPNIEVKKSESASNTWILK